MPWVNQTATWTIVAGEDLAADQLVKISPTDGLGYLACAGAGIEELPALGIAETTVSAGEIVAVKGFGQVYQTSVNLFPGDLVYVSNTPGAIATAPGNTSQIFGYAITRYQYVIWPDLLASDTQASSSSSCSSSCSSSSCSSSCSSSSTSSSSCSSSESSCSSSSSSSSESSSSCSSSSESSSSCSSSESSSSCSSSSESSSSSSSESSSSCSSSESSSSSSSESSSSSSESSSSSSESSSSSSSSSSSESTT